VERQPYEQASLAAVPFFAIALMTTGCSRRSVSKGHPQTSASLDELRTRGRRRGQRNATLASLVQ
jgi:hypothetical protein